MATVGLYGNSVPYGGTYFEWFIFQQSATAPSTPTGGSWDFIANTGVPPTGWSTTPPASPTNIVWASIAIVSSLTGSTITWTVPATWVQPGTPGTSGYSGISGYSGKSGFSGTNGASGISGYSGSGISGYSGYSGSGTSGYSGYSGLGLSGYSGISGYSGVSGYSGYSGSGVSGYSGSGISGYSGYSGYSGSGLSGYSGYSGLGLSGYSGISGYSGTSGYSGSGISGFSGYSGFSGAPGSGAGTVTSVGMTVPSFMSVSGSPIMSSGTLGVTATTTGANSIVLRDTNQNISANSMTEGFSNVAAAGTTTTLVVGSVPNYVVTGSGGQTYKLPDATTLTNGVNYTFNNNQTSGTIVVQNNATTTVATIQSGGFVEVILLSNSTAAGTWDVHTFAPSNVSWSTNTFDYAGSITSATWNGVAVAINRGGTGLSSVGTSGYALVSNGTALTYTAFPTGVSGYSGYSGASGISGFSGISGYSGYSGSGVSGYSGSGISGYSGFSGISGYSGFSGTSVTTSTANTWTATQTFNGSTSTFATTLLDANETVNVVASAPSATTNFYVQSGGVQYYTSNAANNWTLNIAFSSGTSLNTALSTGQSVTFTLVTTQSTTAYYNSAVTIDGTSVTPKWIGGAPTAGNASGLDVYRGSIIKTASATYTVIMSLTQFKT